MSMGALIAIKEMGYIIPDDIEVICFDDSDWASIFEPPITAVRQPVYQMGSTATELLIKKIELYSNFCKELYRRIKWVW